MKARNQDLPSHTPIQKPQSTLIRKPQSLVKTLYQHKSKTPNNPDEDPYQILTEARNQNPT